jgi:hypothetical protein
LNEFFREEEAGLRPGPYFTQQVMTRLFGRVPEIWDLIPRARVQSALALILLFAVLAVQILFSGTAVAQSDRNLWLRPDSKRAYVAGD